MSLYLGYMDQKEKILNSFSSSNDFNYIRAVFLGSASASTPALCSFRINPLPLNSPIFLFLVRPTDIRLQKLVEFYNLQLYSADTSSGTQSASSLGSKTTLGGTSHLMQA
jgi:hypothetical protein